MGLTSETKKAMRDLFEDTINILDHITPENDETLDETALKYVEWCKTKAELKYGKLDDDGVFHAKKYPNFPVFHSGIYWAHLGINIGSEENKHRPVLLLRASRQSDQCTIIPLSTQKLNDEWDFHVDLTGYDNTALVEHLRVISKMRLDKPMRSKGKISSVSDEDMEIIYEQINKFFGTLPPKKKNN